MQRLPPRAPAPGGSPMLKEYRKILLQSGGQCDILNAPKGMILPKVTPEKSPQERDCASLKGGLFAWDVLTARNRAGQATCRHSS